MTTLTKFDASTALPAHIAKMFGETGGNEALSAGVSAGFPILSYKGKVWHLVQGDTRTLIAGPDGDPKPSIEVVILKANPNISKIYYEAGYVEGSSEKPTCYSHDGKAPALDAVVRQAATCAVCPRNQWGSRITEQGAKGKECSDSRRLAVAPVNDLDNPMLLRVPAGTLKELVTYADMLNRRRTPYQAVVTKVSFDHTVAHQKFLFTPLRFLEPEELAQVSETMSDDIVAQITGGGGTATAEFPPVREPVAQPKPVTTAPAERPKPAAPKAVEVAAAPFVLPAEEPVIRPKSALLTDADATLDNVLASLFDDEN